MDRRVLSFLTALLLAAQLLAPGAQAALPGTNGGLTSATYRFCSYTGEILTDTCYFSDAWFLTPAQEENAHLATASMALSLASGADRSVGYAAQSGNLTSLLRELGFRDVETNAYYGKKAWEQSAGCAAAHKTIRTGAGETYTLLAVIPRSSGYEREWAGNFTVGASGLHKGFNAARDELLRFTKQYIERHGISGSVKLWTAGHSRGGAAANLLGGFLADAGSDYLGVGLTPDDVYCYTFACPTNQPNSGTVTKAEALRVAGGRGAGGSGSEQSSAADDTPGAAWSYTAGDAGETIDPAGERYRCIHNYLLDCDAVPMLPFAAWGFTRYGVDTEVNDDAHRTAMLGQLQRLSQACYERYLYGGDPDAFAAYRPELTSLRLVPEGAYVDDQSAFLAGRLARAAEAVSTRENYVGGGYQQFLQLLASLLAGEDGAALDAFFDGVWKLGALELVLTVNTLAADGGSARAAEKMKNLLAAGVGNLPEEARTRYAALAENDALIGAGTKFLSALFFGTEQGGSDSPLKIAATLFGNVNSCICAHCGETMLSWLRARDDCYEFADPAEPGGLPDATAAVYTLSGGGVLTAVTVTRANGATDWYFRLPASDGARSLAVDTVLTGPGVVAAACAADGTRTVLRDSVLSGGCVRFTLDGSARVCVFDNAGTFSDVPAAHWARTAAAFMSARELMDGTGGRRFSPDEPMTRAMLTALLARIDGADAAGADWKEKAAAWGTARGITDGTAPDGAVTREQLVTMLWRYAGCPRARADLSGWTDAGEVSDYASGALAWAAENGLIGGTDGKSLAPQGVATRAQAAQLMMNYMTR